MEIPEALRSLTSEKYDFINVLLQDESKGVIVARIALLDFVLGEVIASFFCGPSRRSDFLDTVMSRLSFDNRIGTLKELAIEGGAADLRDKIVRRLRPMQQLRNKAAHASGLKGAEIDRLFSDQAKRDMLADFPNAFEQAAKEVQEWLAELETIPGFRPEPNESAS